MAISPTINDIVDFQLVVNGVLGDERTDCVVSADKMSYQVARMMDQEIAVKHSNLFQYFKNKVNGVDNPNAYNYFAVTLPNGKTEVIGYPWVNEATFKTIEGRTKTFTITNYQEKMSGPLAKALRDLGASYTTHETAISKSPHV